MENSANSMPSNEVGRRERGGVVCVHKHTYFYFRVHASKAQEITQP